VNKRKLPNLYYIILLFLAFIFIGYQTLYFIRQNYLQDEVAVKGKMDLSDKSFENKLIALQGEFEFYWKQLLEPEDFDSNAVTPEHYMTLPGIWNQKTINGKLLQGPGYATYRLVITVPEQGRYGIKMKEFDTAYELWVNDGHISVGQVAKSKSDIIPSWKRKEAFFESDGKKIEMIVQVANFHHRKGGPEDIMLFGKEDTIYNAKYRMVSVEMFLLGFLALAFLYHLGVYFFRLKELSNLFFAIIVFFVALRLSLTGEKLFLDFFPAVDWFFALRIEYLTLVVPPMFFILFFHSLYPNYKSRIIHKAAIIVLIVFSLGVIVLPPDVFTYFSMIFQPFILFVAIYAVYYLIKNIRFNEKDAVFLLAGTVILVLITFNELLFYNKMLQTGYLMPFGLLIFIFSFSYGLSGKFTHAMNETEKLKNELQRYNAQLEEMVLSRTNELHQKNIELEKQTLELQKAFNEQSELLKFRESMTGLLVHDMKNPISAILTLDEESSEEHIMLAKQAGKQLHNLIQNMMDIQKFEELKIRTSFEPNNFKEISENAVEQIQYLVNLKGISMKNKIQEDINFVFDAHLIERVLINLLSNAVNYTPENGHIMLSYELIENYLKVYVEDDGIGIHKEYHNKIFEKYGQVDEQKKTSGLGLTFCKMAVEAHRGKIGLVSEVQKGSTFWFTIPTYL